MSVICIGRSVFMGVGLSSSLRTSEKSFSSLSFKLSEGDNSLELCLGFFSVRFPFSSICAFEFAALFFVRPLPACVRLSLAWISPARLSGEGCLGAFEFPALLDCCENVCLACCIGPVAVKFFFFCLLRLAPRIWFGNPLGMRPMAWRSTQLTSISSCMWGEMIASTKVSTPWELVMMRACPSTCICSPFAASRMMY